MGFNRTFMELKSVNAWYPYFVELEGFNRTFMELKLDLFNSALVKGRFNRTFMELKFTCKPSN